VAENNGQIRANKKARNRVIVVGFFSVIAIVVFLESPLTRVRAISVEGNASIPAPRLLQDATLQNGMSLWQVNAAAMQNSILLKEPLVSSVQISENLLQARVTIHIVEKHVVALFEQSNQFYRLLSDGTVYDSVALNAGVTWPIITGAHPVPIRLGHPLPNGDVDKLCQQLAKTSETDLMDVSEFHVESFGQTTAYLNSGFEARLNVADIATMMPKVLSALSYFRDKGYAPGLIIMTSLPFRYTPFLGLSQKG